MTKLESTEVELTAARKRNAELENIVAALTAENALLRSQVLRFENVKNDPTQLMFLTGLTLPIWNALWSFLKASPKNVLSAKSAATEVEGRVRFPGAGRKPVLSMEDQLFMTLMRLRLGRSEQDLAYQFGVSLSSVSRTIVM